VCGKLTNQSAANRAVLSSCQNDLRVRSGSQSLGGRAFQDAGPETENYRGPRVVLRQTARQINLVGLSQCHSVLQQGWKLKKLGYFVNVTGPLRTPVYTNHFATGLYVCSHLANAVPMDTIARIFVQVMPARLDWLEAYCFLPHHSSILSSVNSLVNTIF